MTPEQFLSRVSKQPPASAYLFLGQEGYQRGVCKDALLSRVVPGVARVDGLTVVDLEGSSLSAVLDDARSMSLFATDRVLWVTSAEFALPRRMAQDDEEVEGEKGPESILATYLASPTPGTVVVFECSRYDFSGDDRPKLERVQKFYSPISATVEFRHYTPESSRYLAQELAKKHNLKIAGAELVALLEATAGDAAG